MVVIVESALIVGKQFNRNVLAINNLIGTYREYNFLTYFVICFGVMLLFHSC